MLTPEQENKIIQAIEEAEKLTSGEIRVHVEAECKLEPIERAIEVFNQLGMDKTALRNGVLIYVAYQTHCFAIIGDIGLDEKLPKGFWIEVKEKMLESFKINQLSEGICTGVEMAGEKLASFFPYLDDDTNELPNEISTN
jgi:uncharacterized membrane protein